MQSRSAPEDQSMRLLQQNERYKRNTDSVEKRLSAFFAYNNNLSPL